MQEVLGQVLAALSFCVCVCVCVFVCVCVCVWPPVVCLPLAYAA